MRMSERHRKESASEAWPPRAALRVLTLFALLLSLTLAAAPSADASAGAFLKAYGWGVSDGAKQFEICTTTCDGGIGGAGAGEFESPAAVATDSSGDVYVADEYNDRIEEFSAAGAFIKAYGWGVLDGANHFETCTTTCQTGIGENTTGTDGAGELFAPTGVATDSSGDVYVADDDARINEFSAAGAFIKAYGWGVLDGANHFETCTSACEGGIVGSGAGQLDDPVSVATDSTGDVDVADEGNDRIEEFSAAGAFLKAYGWGVLDGASKFETCTTTCEAGIGGSGAGQLYTPTGVGTDPSGDVYVADDGNNRIDEFSAAGAFLKAYGWGVLDGASRFETCATTCSAGIGGGPEGDGEGAGGAGALFDPWGVATDSSGDVYVADLGNQRIDEFSAAGAFIAAYGWGVADGASKFETCTTTCQAGPFDEGDGFENPTDVAIDPSGDVYVADYAINRIDEFSVAGAATCASAPSITVQPAAQTVTAPAAATFAAAGSTPANCSAPAVHWSSEAPGATSFSPIPGATSTSYKTPATTTAQSGTKYEATFTNAVGSTTTSAANLTVRRARLPSNEVPPAITGTLEAGKELSCSTGSWTNDPKEFAFQWIRNGTTLDGATGDTYTLGTLDEGTTLTCRVTAINAAGQASATSKAVKVPIPYVRRCPAATGTMTGTQIGLLKLGMTRAQARFVYRRHSSRGFEYKDFFCLTPEGVRAGYATPKLLKTLSNKQAHAVKGRVVWASTSDPYYSLDGIRAGESIATASRVLGTEPPFHIGLNYWYLARKATYTAVLKVRGTVVQELGIADNALTKTRNTQNVLMHSFY
jgi:NHL repeat